MRIISMHACVFVCGRRLQSESMPRNGTWLGENHLKLLDIIFCLALACTQNTPARTHPEIIYIKLCGFLIIHVIIPLLCVYVLYASAWCRWDHYKLSTPTSEVDGFNSSPTHSHSFVTPSLGISGSQEIYTQTSA